MKQQLKANTGGPVDTTKLAESLYLWLASAFLLYMWQFQYDLISGNCKETG